MALVQISTLLVLAAFQVGFIHAFGANYTYIASTHAWYRYHDKAATWVGARDRCLSEGSLLFHPATFDELDTVLKVLDIQTIYYLFTGFSDFEEPKVYKTVDGRPLEEVYVEWEREDPAYGLSDDGNRCGLLGNHFLKFHISSCNTYQPFICKASLDHIVKTLKDTKNTIANLTAKLADLEGQLANQTVVLEAVERKAQTTKIQDDNQITALEILTANKTAALKEKRREEQIVETLEQILKAGKSNQI